MNIFTSGNTIKTAASLIAASAFALSSTAMAEYNRGTVEEATVLSADPIYRTIRVNEPVEQCWDEKVYVPSHQTSRSHTPKSLGAIIGAAVGHEFGKGRGKDLATVAGAVLGGSVGRDVQRNSHGRSRVEYERRCELVDNYRTQERIDGYDVSYRYNGRVYNTQTARDPGPTIAVSVSVVPVE